MKRKDVTLFLRDALALLLEAQGPDLVCPVTSVEEYLDSEQQFSLHETHQYLEALSLESESTDSDAGTPDELDQSDWEDFMISIEYLRIHRQSPRWEQIYTGVQSAQKWWLPHHPYALERLSLWDILLHIVLQDERASAESFLPSRFDEASHDTISTLVNGKVPAKAEIEAIVLTAKDFLREQLERLSESEETEEAQWQSDSSSLHDDDEDEWIEDQEGDSISNNGYPTQEEIDRECLEELLDDLLQDWESLVSALYA